MGRIVVLDLLFNWPPEGGARVDTLELTRYLSAGHEARMFVPRIRDTFRRGVVDLPRDALGIDLEVADVPDSVTDHHGLCDWIRGRLDRFGPDLLILGDAWHLKARLMAGLADYAPVVRFYAHESLCLKGHGHQFRDGRICEVDALARSGSFQRECLPCWGDWRASTTTRVFDREMELACVDDATYRQDLRRGLSAARAVVVTNTQMVRRLAPHTSRVILQPMGVDVGRFRPRSAPTGHRFLLHGRAYDYLKGAHVLIDAGRILRRRGRNFTVAITGRPPTLPAEAMPDFVEELEPVPHPRVPELIEGALCGVLPAVWPEPLPLSALESMACGRPIIASAVGGFTDLIESGANGLLVLPGDAVALADAMERLLREPELVQALSTAAVETARRYQWHDLHRRAYGPILEEL